MANSHTLRSVIAIATPEARAMLARALGRAEAQAFVDEVLKPLGFTFTAEHVEPMANAIADHLDCRSAFLLELGFMLSDVLAYMDEYHRARDAAQAALLARFAEGVAGSSGALQ